MIKHVIKQHYKSLLNGNNFRIYYDFWDELFAQWSLYASNKNLGHHLSGLWSCCTGGCSIERRLIYKPDGGPQHGH